MKLKLYQIDAFTSQVFRGNPAAVLPLDEWLDDSTMQAIATENNLSETAFFVPRGGGCHLRWFTPTQEVPFCGHATLASSFVIFNILGTSNPAITFETLSGVLTVRKDGDLFVMNFPKMEYVFCEAPRPLLDGLGKQPSEVFRVDADPNYYAVYDDENDVRSMSPDLRTLEQLHPYSVVITAASKTVDFVSRYFAPSYGIPEDPVTGSIHSALVPYWSARLGKTKLHAEQASKRGGQLFCENTQDGVVVAGHGAKFMEGEIDF
jgi:PhzF family phenazine biosynthesis protein